MPTEQITEQETYTASPKLAILAVKALPPSIRRVLARVGFARADIEIRVRDERHVSSCGNAGSRSFYATITDVNSADEPSIVYGSWGGPNAFTRNAVDDINGAPHEVPTSGAIITGHSGSGGERTWADVSVRRAIFDVIAPPLQMAGIDEVMGDAIAAGRSDVVAELAALGAVVPLTDSRYRILDVFYSYKGGHRQKYLDGIAAGGPSYFGARPGVGVQAVTDDTAWLVSNGYLRRSSNGATAMTTKGKNAIALKRAR